MKFEILHVRVLHLIVNLVLSTNTPGWNGSRTLAILLCNHDNFMRTYEPNSHDVTWNLIKISPDSRQNHANAVVCTCEILLPEKIIASSC